MANLWIGPLLEGARVVLMDDRDLIDRTVLLNHAAEGRDIPFLQVTEIPPGAYSLCWRRYVEETDEETSWTIEGIYVEEDTSLTFNLWYGLIGHTVWGDGLPPWHPGPPAIEHWLQLPASPTKPLY